MKILVAPNAFKGSMTALQAARAMRRGVLAALPGARVSLLPISDGGDGLLDSVLTARRGKKIEAAAIGPLGEKRRAAFALLEDGTAVVEMARASGLAIASRRDPLRATSYGTGELIAAARRRGAKTIWVGLGGSASNDGGAGMAQALGFRLLDRAGRDLEPGAQALLRLQRIERGSWTPIKVVGITDVANPLTGPRGSARVFGPQKGATPRMVAILEDALERYARVVARDLGVDVARAPGAGAAGGMGAGLLAFLGAELRPGAAWVLRLLDARRALKGVDALISGEGRMDETSFFGKAPVELARRAKALGIPAAMVCGSVDEEIGALLKKAGVRAAVALADAGAPASQRFAQAPRWTARAAALAVARMGLGALLLAGLGVGAQAEPEPSAAVSSSTQALAEADRLYFHRHVAGNLESSNEKLRGILEARPDQAAALWRWGRGLIRLGERQKKKKGKIELFIKGEEKIKSSVDADPSDAEAHFWLGVAMGRRGEIEGIFNSMFLLGPIRKEMAAAVKLDPNHGGAHHVLGEIYRQLPRLAGGSKKKALAEFEEAVRLSPDHSSNYMALAETYVDVGEKEKAVAALERALAIKTPDDPAEFESDVKDVRILLEKLKGD